MNIDTFLNMAENMVIEYYNRYVNNGGRPVSKSDLSYSFITDNGEIFEVGITIYKDKSTKYIICYDIKTKDIKSYLCKEINNMVTV